MTLRHLAVSFLAASAALFLAPTGAVLAHEVGAIHVSSHQVSVGGTVTVRGEKLEKSEPVSLELRGVLHNYPVGNARTDTAGRFEMSLRIPENVPVGPYTLVAIASDGDVTGRTDLAVTAAAMPQTAQAGPGTSSGMTNMPIAGSGTEERATAAVMSIANPATLGEWVTIWLLTLGCLVAGIAFLRMARGTSG